MSLLDERNDGFSEEVLQTLSPMIQMVQSEFYTIQNCQVGGEENAKSILESVRDQMKEMLLEIDNLLE